MVLGVLLIPLPSQSQSSTDAVLVGAAQPVDEAWMHISASPLTIGDLEAAEKLLRQADQVLGPAIGTAEPASWAKERGIDSLLLIELFNRFNETSDSVEAARRFQHRVVWSLDAETRRYLEGKGKRLSAAKKELPPERYQLFLAVGRDGDVPAMVTRPWTTRTGPRYGFDIGRFQREERATIGPDGRLTVEKHVKPMPWPDPKSTTTSPPDGIGRG